MSKASIPIGIYVISSGILLGFAVAFFSYAALDEFGSEGRTSAVVAFLAVIGVSGTTIGVGVLVILMGRVLAALNR